MKALEEMLSKPNCGEDDFTRITVWSTIDNLFTELVNNNGGIRLEDEKGPSYLFKINNNVTYAKLREYEYFVNNWYKFNSFGFKGLEIMSFGQLKPCRMKDIVSGFGKYPDTFQDLVDLMQFEFDSERD